MQFEYSFSGKWLELLKQIAPQVTRAAVLRNSDNRAGAGEFAAIQSMAQSLDVELRLVDTRDAGETNALSQLSPALRPACSTPSIKTLENGSAALASAATRCVEGNTSRISSTVFAGISDPPLPSPVTLPPGRPKLEIRPVPTGSPTLT
ncbi:MAG: hypothetical protein WBE42_20660, partial [Pseudolabrys sp.]